MRAEKAEQHLVVEGAAVHGAYLYACEVGIQFQQHFFNEF